MFILLVKCFDISVPKPVPPNATFSQRMINCGKAGRGCRRCADGREHGPYWYAQWHALAKDGKVVIPLRTISAYVGRALPQSIPDERLITLVDGRRVTAGAFREGLRHG